MPRSFVRWSVGPSRFGKQLAFSSKSLFVLRLRKKLSEKAISLSSSSLSLAVSFRPRGLPFLFRGSLVVRENLIDSPRRWRRRRNIVSTSSNSDFLPRILLLTYGRIRRICRYCFGHSRSGLESVEDSIDSRQKVDWILCTDWIFKFHFELFPFLDQKAETAGLEFKVAGEKVITKSGRSVDCGNSDS